jgi:hypothetical protein
MLKYLENWRSEERERDQEQRTFQPEIRRENEL